jgi:DNA-directed RNA polymerase subunit RPC12/RpoP
MALIQCHECHQAVSTESPRCPHCGAKVINPEKLRAYGLVFVFFLIILGWGFWPDSDKTKAEKAAKEAAAEAACRADLKCWGDKNSATADVYCQEPIERTAIYSMRWTVGTYDPKFSRFSWLNKQAGTLKYFGDKAEFQNAFGAYIRVTYECDINPESHNVISVNTYTGQL